MSDRVDPRLLVVLPLVVALDQATKQVVVHVLERGREIAFGGPLLALGRSENPAAMFAFGSGLSPSMQRMFVIALSVAAVAALGWLYRVIREPGARTGLVLVLGGACSTLLDRMLYGGVIDFVFLSLGSAGRVAFNLADVFVLAGLARFAFEPFRRGRAASPPEPS